jgi:hypothetical protein
VAARSDAKSSREIARSVERARAESGLTAADVETGFMQKVAGQLDKTLKWNQERAI